MVQTLKTSNSISGERNGLALCQGNGPSSEQLQFKVQEGIVEERAEDRSVMDKDIYCLMSLSMVTFKLSTESRCRVEGIMINAR